MTGGSDVTLGQFVERREISGHARIRSTYALLRSGGADSAARRRCHRQELMRDAGCHSFANADFDDGRCLP
jgi:hypothetical protein